MKFRLKGASGELTGQPFELKDQTTIGSAADADIRLDGLAATHARIVFDGQTLLLEGDNDAWVNGEAVDRRALATGDEIRLGAHRFVLQAPGLRPPNVLTPATVKRRLGPWIWAGAAVAAAAAAWLVWVVW